VQSPLSKRHNSLPIFAVLLLTLSGCGSDNDPVLEETFEQSYRIQSAADISIQNGDGAVLLYGSNTDEMQVHATKKAYSSTRLKEIVIDVSAHSTSVSINVKIPAKPAWAFFDRSGTVDCTIVVPATANVSALRLNAGEVFIDGMRGGSVHAWLGDGRMFVHNCFTDTDLGLQRGNLALSYDWWESESVSVQGNVNRGNASVFLPTAAAFNLIAEAAHGRIGNDFDDRADTPSAQIAKVQMSVHGGGKTTIKVRSGAGDVKIVEANP
jgi:hypothetical protein